jgi:hypothetical protein
MADTALHHINDSLSDNWTDDWTDNLASLPPKSKHSFVRLSRTEPRESVWKNGGVARVQSVKEIERAKKNALHRSAGRFPVAL